MSKESEGYEVVKSIITDQDTGQVAAVETNGALAVNIQDQTSLALDLHFAQEQDSDTLAAQADPEDTTITLTDATGFVDGSWVGVFATGIFFFAEQVGAASGNVITLDTPVDRTFANGSTVRRFIREMNVDGSSTTQTFKIGPIGTGVDVDITRILGYLEDDISMDDSKFGGISALTNGVVLRINNSVISNIWNVKTNGELGLLCFDFSYTDKAPAGKYGARFRNTYAGQSKHGVTLRLESGESLEILIQDDLTGLDSFRMMAQGHVVTD